MIIVKIEKNTSIDRAIKIYSNKLKKLGVAKELRARSQFTKKSEKRREEKRKAIYIQKLKNEEEN